MEEASERRVGSARDHSIATDKHSTVPAGERIVPRHHFIDRRDCGIAPPSHVARRTAEATRRLGKAKCFRRQSIATRDETTRPREKANVLAETTT